MITGYEAAVAEASEKLKEAGAKRVLPLKSAARSIPMLGSSRKRAGKAGGCRLHGVEDSVCDKCNRPVCPRYCTTTALSGTAGVIFGVLAAECGDDATGSRYLRGDRTGKNTDRLFMRKINRDVKGYNIRTYEEMHQVAKLYYR